MKSLKTQLNELIEKQSYLSLDQAYAFGATLKAKNKTVERELNPSRSPNVFTVKNERKQIVGYRWVGTQETAPRPFNLKETITRVTDYKNKNYKECCVWGGRNNLHASNCPTKVKEIIKNVLF